MPSDPFETQAAPKLAAPLGVTAHGGSAKSSPRHSVKVPLLAGLALSDSLELLQLQPPQAPPMDPSLIQVIWLCRALVWLLCILSELTTATANPVAECV